MEEIRTFSGNTETEIWQQVLADLAGQGEWFSYQALLQQGGYQVQLDIDIDPGGGFESGSESTQLLAWVPGAGDFRFALREQNWVRELGKLAGMTDVELGDPEIDAAYIITTNNPPFLHDLLADPALRQTLLLYRGLRLTLGPVRFGPDDTVALEFSHDTAITEPAQLQEIYHLMLTLLQQLVPPAASATVPAAQ